MIILQLKSTYYLLGLRFLRFGDYGQLKLECAQSRQWNVVGKQTGLGHRHSGSEELGCAICSLCDLEQVTLLFQALVSSFTYGDNINLMGIISTSWDNE